MTNESSHPESRRGRMRLAGVEQTDAAFAQAGFDRIARAIRRATNGRTINASMLPSTRPPAIPIFMDDANRSFMAQPLGDSTHVLRFAPGSEAATGGGFTSIDSAPDSTGSNQRTSDASGVDPGDADPAAFAADMLGPGVTDDGFAAQAARAAMEQSVMDVARQMATTGDLAGALRGAADIGSAIGAFGNAALGQLHGMAMAGLADALFGSVDDSSGLGSQLAAKYGPQMLSTYGPAAISALASGGLSDVLAPVLAPTPSGASIPVGFNVSMPGGSGDIVGIGGFAATRKGDVAVAMPECQDIGEILTGNDTILINGAPAAGLGDLVIGKKGSVGTLKDTNPTVLMGASGGGDPGAMETSVGVNSNGSSGGGGGGGGSCGVNGGGQLSQSGICEPCALDTPKNAPSLQDHWFAKLADDLGIGAIEQKVAPDGKTYENLSLFGGFIDLGSPQLPGAGTYDADALVSPWWIPDRIGPYDMSDYYLFHDCNFSFARDVRNAGDAVAVEYDAFRKGMSNPERSVDPVAWGLQAIYSGATLTVGLGAVVGNTVDRFAFGGSGVDPKTTNPVEYDRECAHDGP